MKVSKNQVVCALCHFAGLQSGMDCSIWSSAEKGSVSCIVMLRISRYCSRKGLQLNFWARLAGMAGVSSPLSQIDGRLNSAPKHGCLFAGYCYIFSAGKVSPVAFSWRCGRIEPQPIGLDGILLTFVVHPIRSNRGMVSVASDRATHSGKRLHETSCMRKIA